MPGHRHPAANIIPLPPEAPRSNALVGRVVDILEGGLVVDVPCHGPARARLAMAMSAERAYEAASTRAEVLLALEGGDPGRPIVLGLIENGFCAAPTQAYVDGRRVVFEGKEEVVLACGEATITLKANGRILIRGAYVETRSSGTNRIKGGSVQIN